MRMNYWDEIACCRRVFVWQPTWPSLVAMIAFAAMAAESMADDALTLHPKVQSVASLPMGPFVKLKDDRVLCVDQDAAITSTDGGATWSAPTPLFKSEQNLSVSNERALLRTRDGAIILVFMNKQDRQWGWDEKANAPRGEVWMRVWSVRSLDEGRTWQDAQMIQDGYCGCVRDIKQTSAGNVVVCVQRLLPEFARHATITYSSADEGKTWQASNLLDIGGRGHHDGAIESTTVELKDGRMWLLLRTNLDRFWQAHSQDHGNTWTTFGPTNIDASSAPGMITRLASGRLALVWNRLYPQGAETFPRTAGNWSATPCSVHREELAIAFSHDEGQSWTEPIVLARKPKTWLSYPHIFEHQPGELWVTTMQGGLRLKLQERDFAGK